MKVSLIFVFLCSFWFWEKKLYLSNVWYLLSLRWCHEIQLSVAQSEDVVSYLFFIVCTVCWMCQSIFCSNNNLSNKVPSHRCRMLNSSQLLATGIVISCTYHFLFLFLLPYLSFSLSGLKFFSLTFFNTRIYSVDSRFTICDAQQLIRKWINRMHFQMHHQLIQIIRIVQSDNHPNGERGIFHPQPCEFIEWNKLQIASIITCNLILDQSY